MNWLTAYKVNKVETGRWWWKNFFYEIVFNDDVIMEVFDYHEANQICMALNGAYNLGRTSTRVGT